MSDQSGQQLGDGSLRAIHRLAVANPDEKWPARLVAELTDELIRRRGTDTTWLAFHPQEAESHG